jgi:hypothetical protein
VIIDLSDVLKYKQIESLRVVYTSGNRHYHNSQTIYTVNGMKGLWFFALSYFLFVLNDKGGKNRGDYVNFCFGYTVSENYIMYIYTGAAVSK